MSSPVQTTPDPRDQAIDWFVRRKSEAAKGSAEAFQHWIEADPENAEAYAEVELLWSATAEVAARPDVTAWQADLEAGLGRRRVSRRAIAASLAAAIIGLGGVGAYQWAAPKPLVDQSFRTDVGQQATVTLPDGSTLTLNTDTVVRTRADKEKRLVYLDKGQAYFKVAKDRGHPFVVTAAGRTVTALGTAFDVRVEGGALKVVLVEGKVRVESLAPETAARPKAAGVPVTAAIAAPVVATEMSAGTQLTAPSDADWRVTRANVARDTSWLAGQIVIDDEPLGEVIAELNRYSKRKIVLGDPSLSTTRVSGIFRPGDIEGFARALKTSGLAQVGQETDGQYRIMAMK